MFSTGLVLRDRRHLSGSGVDHLPRRPGRGHRRRHRGVGPVAPLWGCSHGSGVCGSSRRSPSTTSSQRRPRCRGRSGDWTRPRAPRWSPSSSSWACIPDHDRSDGLGCCLLSGWPGMWWLRRWRAPRTAAGSSRSCCGSASRSGGSSRTWPPGRSGATHLKDSESPKPQGSTGTRKASSS